MRQMICIGSENVRAIDIAFKMVTASAIQTKSPVVWKRDIIAGDAGIVHVIQAWAETNEMASMLFVDLESALQAAEMRVNGAEN